MHARNIQEFDDWIALLGDPDRVASMKADLEQGDVFIGRRFLSKDRVLRIREYLQGLALNSLPNYEPIVPNCPNFHRIDRWDPRAHVGACLHSFSFFPWNHDVLNLFRTFGDVYRLKNRLSGLEGESFLGLEPDRGCVARMSFQYYPKGGGGIHHHQDPYDYHQITVPALTMCKRGVEFHEGGAYVDAEDRRVHLDDLVDYGDVTYFNAKCFHGVEPIDPDAGEDWLSFEGRWMGLFAVNKVVGNEAIPDSRDLERGDNPY